MGRRRSRILVVTSVLVLAASSSAAAHCPPCHPDPLGTRVLEGPGTVQRYAVVGDEVRVVYADGPMCYGTFIWNVARGPGQTTVKPVCGAAVRPIGGSQQRLVAPSGSSTVRIRFARGADAADRAEVISNAGGRVVHSWPLFFHPRSVSTYEGIAVFATAGLQGLYALRLSDGRLAMLAAERPSDTPVISRIGVVYNDDLQRYRPTQHGFTVKAIPLPAVRSALNGAGRPIETHGRIVAASADGARLALGVAASGSMCSRLLLWHAPWAFVARVSSQTEATCPPGHGTGGISSVALAGDRAEWVTTYGRSETIIAASVIACEEWVIARLAAAAGGDELAGISGDGRTIALAVSNHERELRGASAVDVVSGDWRAHTIQDAHSAPVAISADEGRIAVLGSDGVVTITTTRGESVRTLETGAALAISLRSRYLAVLTRNRAIDVYSLSSGRREAHVRMPPAVRPELDVYYRTAVVTARNLVLAADLRTGKIARIVRTPTPVRAQVESAGIFYTFNRGNVGHAGFVPTAKIERAIARRPSS